MINSVMIMNFEEEHPATLDYGLIDLHSGMCDLVKIGAATTFVKRGNWVEIIKSTSMPLGMFSDGVIDALESDDNDKRLVDIIKSIKCNTPKKMADKILEKAALDATALRDDMTVLVTGIWENGKKTSALLEV